MPEISHQDSRIGQRLLHYTLIEVIGQGGMSIVYKGKDERLKRDVAIKVLHPFLAQKPDCRERLTREARLVALLQHPHIVQVYDYSGEEDTPTTSIEELFLVAEYVPGLTLRDYVPEQHLWQVPEIGALITWELARTLHYAHEHGVVHRDIKPENILVRKDGMLKLMDFGIAQIADQSSLTITGTLLGSPAHMAPESIEGKPTNERSDIFSLTTVLYWLTTGQLPFSHASAHATLRAIAEGRYTPAQQLNPRITDELNAVITRGMQTDPEKRFANAQELADAIGHALGQLGITPDSALVKNLLESNAKRTEFKKSVEHFCLENAKRYMQQGETAKSLSFLNRVLAEDPDNHEAATLLEQSMQYAPTKKNSWVWAAGFCLFLFLAGLTWFLVAPPKQEPVTSPIVPIAGAKIESEKPAILPIELNHKEAKAEEKPEQKPRPKADAAVLVPTSIRALPFADIYIDGKLVAQNAQNYQANLEPGSYNVTFKHKYATTQTRTLEIKTKQKSAALEMVLKESKPSLLSVRCNTQADIVVEGIYKGSTEGTLNRPVLIPLPQRTQSTKLEVIVTKEGYKPYVQMHQFVAGEKTILTIHLTPLQQTDSQKDKIHRSS